MEQQQQRQERQLKLGRLPTVKDVRTLRAKTIWVENEKLPSLPVAYNVHKQLNIVDNRMFANDRYGDCVKAAKHIIFCAMKSTNKVN